MYYWSIVANHAPQHACRLLYYGTASHADHYDKYRSASPYDNDLSAGNTAVFACQACFVADGVLLRYTRVDGCSAVHPASAGLGVYRPALAAASMDVRAT